jgi:NAD(P)-dependent dehydrogenase (short-subunit alcohol dehydrogenase family)
VTVSGTPRELAVITGAAVRLGRAMALALAERGYAIGLHYFRSAEQARATAEQIERAGVPVLLLRADLRQPEQIVTLFDKVAESPYRLSLLVNSAGQMQRADLLTLSPADWDATLTLNLRAPWLCARSAAALMKPEGGLIVNLSDTGAGMVWPGFPAYAVSKAGVEMLTRLLARRLAPAIRVNAIAPGLVLKPEEMPEEEWRRLVEKMPLKRAVSLESLVQALLFLVDTPYITGETLVIDSGYRLT